MQLAQWISESGIDIVAIANPSTSYCFTCGSKVRTYRVESDTISTCVKYWCLDCEAFVDVKGKS